MDLFLRRLGDEIRGLLGRASLCNLQHDPCIWVVAQLLEKRICHGDTKKKIPESANNLRNISCTPLVSKVFKSYPLGS